MNRTLKLWSSTQFPGLLRKREEKGNSSNFPIDDLSNFEGLKTLELIPYPIEFVKVTLSSLLNMDFSTFLMDCFSAFKTLELIPYPMEFKRKGKKGREMLPLKGYNSAFPSTSRKVFPERREPLHPAKARRGKHVPVRFLDSQQKIKNQKIKILEGKD